MQLAWARSAAPSSSPPHCDHRGVRPDRRVHPLQIRRRRGRGHLGVLYFATLFFQDVWGYSALKSSVAYLPWIAAFSIGAAASAQLLPRIGPRPLMVVGSLFGAGGMYWLSRTAR